MNERVDSTMWLRPLPRLRGTAGRGKPLAQCSRLPPLCLSPASGGEDARAASPEPDAAARSRIRLRVRGLVQGVGFRPHVWRLASRHALTGFVLNDQDGVLIEAQAPHEAAIAGFIAALTAEAPSLARIDAVEPEWCAPLAGETAFAIRDSEQRGPARTAITADVAICPDCLAELFDPADRRYLYPFITCTHCGPRFTVTRSLPYDRATTSLAPFPLCTACAAEYTDPADRRFHAETTCCPACGPHLAMPRAEIGARLHAGEIVALKGLGGFHLVCDARRDDVVGRLRARKRRDGKPFAVMVTNLATARRFAALDEPSARLLEHRARPIVVAPLDDALRLAPGVSNGLPTVGLFLPYTPLHWLVLWELLGRPAGRDWMTGANAVALVATSANLSGEPIVIDGSDERLGDVADAVADHDRAIVSRADDSVLRVVDGAPAFLRRARGFTPEPIRLARELPCVAALGAELKATATIIRGREAFVSQHVGDLDTASAVAFLEETYAHMRAILAVEPAAIACDLHPDFATTRLAERLGPPVIPVQHHHAHVAALAAEHHVEGPLLGLSLDGFGLGTDGGAWGGELLRMDGIHFTRIGHLAPLPAPGGDRAAREPWRMAAAALHALGRADEIETRFADQPLARSVRDLLARGIACEPTSSAGRLFDAAAGLLGLSRRQAFEGEAAMRLEGLASAPTVLAEGWRIDVGVIDFLPLLARLADGIAPVDGAALLHGTLIAGLVDWAAAAARAHHLDHMALSGGCFLNKVLSEGVAAGVRRHGLTPLIARAVPPNDGGLSLGQAFVAAHMLASGRIQGAA
jgi:hydrogenase maturation protein HypF